jgi:hypothetical protein
MPKRIRFEYEYTESENNEPENRGLQITIAQYNAELQVTITTAIGLLAAAIALMAVGYPLTASGLLLESYIALFASAVSSIGAIIFFIRLYTIKKKFNGLK